MSDLKDYSAQHAANLRARIEQLEAELATYRSGQLVPLPEVEELAKVMSNDTEEDWLAMPALHKVALMSQARAIINHMKGKDQPHD